MAAPKGFRSGAKAPDKGSFPLDHFHECDAESEIYNKCVVKHQLMPKRCRQYQIDYLQCRMKSGLMEKEEIEKLGFTDDVSWESEEAEKKYLFEKIGSLKKKAYESAWTQAESKFKSKPEKTEKPE